MEGYTGRDFQLDFLGKKIDWQEIFSLKKTDIKKYMPFNQAMEFVEKNYPVERAILPETKVAKDIYNPWDASRFPVYFLNRSFCENRFCGPSGPQPFFDIFLRLFLRKRQQVVAHVYPL